MLYTGKASTFGGWTDQGVGNVEGLALVDPPDLSDWYFDRVFEPASVWKKIFGLARNLDPNAYYCAMRWACNSFEGKPGEIVPGWTREKIRRSLFRIGAGGRFIFVQAVDWGPNPTTGRLIDLSPGAAAALKIKTDDYVTVEPIPVSA